MADSSSTISARRGVFGNAVFAGGLTRPLSPTKCQWAAKDSQHSDVTVLAMRILALTLAVAIVALAACDSGPTAPTNANIAGSYNLTITASSTCAANLPAETRALNYTANITQTGPSFNLSLLAHVIFNSATVIGTVSGQTIIFSTFSFNEITTGGGVALSTTGTASVAADASITGTLNGSFQTPSGASCNAANHQIQLVKK